MCGGHIATARLACVCAKTYACASDVYECVRAHNNKDNVVHLAPSRGQCMAFSSTIPPLQVALSCACSVASLSPPPSFQLPGWRSLHRYSLANYVIGWGKTSSCTRRPSEYNCMSISEFNCGTQESPPNTPDMGPGALRN